jgi:hypothetical protein
MLEEIQIEEEEAEQLLNCLKQLTKYSFCKSHALGDKDKKEDKKKKDKKKEKKEKKKVVNE